MKKKNYKQIIWDELKIWKVEQILEKKRAYWEKRCKEEIEDKNDLQNAYDIAMQEITKLRKKLGYDKRSKKTNETKSKKGYGRSYGY